MSLLIQLIPNVIASVLLAIMAYQDHKTCFVKNIHVASLLVIAALINPETTAYVFAALFFVTSLLNELMKHKYDKPVLQHGDVLGLPAVIAIMHANPYGLTALLLIGGVLPVAIAMKTNAKKIPFYPYLFAAHATSLILLAYPLIL